MTSGVRGGADFIVQVVFRLESHECDLMADGARDRTARLASSDACEICAVNPCLAAMICKIERIHTRDCACLPFAKKCQCRPEISYTLLNDDK